MWLQQFGRPQTTIYCVCWAVPISGNSNYVVFKSTNLLLAVVTILLILYSRLVLYVQGSTFMGILYVGL